MYEIVCVKNNDYIEYVLSNNIQCKKNDIIIIIDDDGLEESVCVKKSNYQEKEENLVFPMKKIIRVADKSDLKTIENNKIAALESIKYASKLCKELNLDMNFVDSIYNFNRTQLLFYYLSDDRIDFRELAKKLAQKYKTRIELRQIGVRDKAKKIGGLGPCGLFLCCNTFLTDLCSVSINMAKNQMIALNPSKINGLCGRLLCCLSYENDTYTNLKKDFPKIGTVVNTKSGTGKVISINIFNNTYNVDLKEKGIITLEKGN